VYPIGAIGGLIDAEELPDYSRTVRAHYPPRAGEQERDGRTGPSPSDVAWYAAKGFLVLTGLAVITYGTMALSKVL